MLAELIQVLFIIAILFPCIVLHEVAHGWTAYKLGDPTAKQAGRLTLNPIKHIDPFGSIIFPGLLFLFSFIGGLPLIIFGWAKPVPVNFLRLRNPKQDMILVGMAGPLSNILFALVLTGIRVLAQVNDPASTWYFFFSAFIFLNLLLATFNMIPVPPLDGSRLVMGLLPNQLMVQYAKLERIGIPLVLFLTLFFNLFEKILIPVVEFLGNLLQIQFAGVIY